MAIVGISTAIIDIRAMDHATGSLRGIASNISQVGRAISGAGLAMTASFTIPMVAAGVASVKLATEFDKSMRNIQAIGKQTDSEIAALGKRFLAQSQDITKTTASADELAEAFYYVQSSGQFGADALNIIDSAAKGATAGLSDVQSVAKSLTSIINSYGMQSSEAAALTDMLVRSVDIGVFTFQDINTQIGDFINTASLMKIPLEQVLAVMTAVTKKGIPVSEAATSLNQILVAYLKPSDEAIKAAKAFGIELGAATIETLGFAGALQDMYNKTGGSEEAMAKIFRNIRSFRGVAALASDGLKTYNQDVVTLRNSAGTTDQVFSVATKSWDSILKNFKNTVTNTGIAIGTILLPMLAQVASAIGRLAEAFSKLSPETQTSIIKFAIAFAALGPVLIIVGQLINSIGILIGVFSGIAAIPTIIGAIGFAALATGAAMSFWNDNTFGVADKLQKLADSGSPVAGIFKAIVIELNNLKMAGFFDAHSPLLDQLLGDGRTAIDVDPVELLAKAIHGVAKETIMARFNTEQFTLAISYLGLVGQKVVGALQIVFGNLATQISKLSGIIGAIFDKTKSSADIKAMVKDYNAFRENAGEEFRMLGNMFTSEDYDAYIAKQNALKDQVDRELRAINAPGLDRAPKTNIVDALLGRGGSILDAISPKNFPSAKIVDDTKKYIAGPMEDGAIILAQVMNAHAAELAKANTATAKSYEVTNGKVNPALEDLAQVGVAVNKTMTPIATELGKIATPEEITAALENLKSGSTDATSSLDKLADASNPLIDAFNSIFQAAAQASKNLMDLTGSGGAGTVTPGANGPFEDIYRLQAWIKDKSWGNVAAKAGVTTDEQAKSIVGAFQNNNWAPAIAAGLINIPELQKMAQAQMASASMGMGENPYGASNLAALQAAGLTPQQAQALVPAKAGGATVKQVTAMPGQAQVSGGGAALNVNMGQLATSMSKDAEENQKSFGEAGAKVFGYWQDGFFSAADTSNLMAALVARLVANAMKSMVPAGVQ